MADVSIRRLPVRPRLDALQHEAEDLLRAIRGSDPAAIAALREYHPDPIDGVGATLADARIVLARAYQASNWQRLMEAVALALATAIWSDDAVRVRELISGNRDLLFDHVLIRTDSNWGPPMTYAANPGRDELIRMRHELGATDLIAGTFPSRNSSARTTFVSAHTASIGW
jgi:hypothetical protein